jgi:hypothetical protein
VSISVIINSAALGDRSKAVLSSSGIPHGRRAYLLHSVILPLLRTTPEVSEIVVVGEYAAGDGYLYVPCPSVAFDCTDALAQRQAGFEASKGDVLVFQHDDHIMDLASLETLDRQYTRDDSWDVLVPRRKARSDNEVLELNSGDGRYVMGHACVMRRSAVERAPWGQVDKVFTWDVRHTQNLTEAGARIRWVSDLVVWDLEERAPGRGW